MNRAERATHNQRMNWNPAVAPLAPIQKRYLALDGLYCVMHDVAQFERNGHDSRRVARLPRFHADCRGQTQLAKGTALARSVLNGRSRQFDTRGALTGFDPLSSRQRAGALHWPVLFFRRE
jgi:hypothetical protein